MKSLAQFVVGGLLFGAAALGVADLLGAESTLFQGGAAFALTFIPAAITLACVSWSFRSTPEMQLLASLGGSGVRMAIALGGALLLTNAFPQSFDARLWTWLVLFYLVLLAFEIGLVVWQQPKVNGSPQA